MDRAEVRPCIPNFFRTFSQKFREFENSSFFRKISELRKLNISELRKPNISETRENEKFGNFRLTQGLRLKNVFAVGEENLSHRPHSLYLGKFHQHSISIFANKRCQFHQHFTRKFFVRTSFLCLEFGFKWTFVRKTRAFNVDEIDGRFAMLPLAFGIERKV